MRNLVQRIFAFGTEGLDPAQARQINVVTVVALIAIAAMPIDTILFSFLGFRIVSLQGVVPILFAVGYLVPLALIALRRRLAAKVALAILINADMAGFAYLYSAQAGVHLFLPAIGLLSFFIFDRTEKPLMAFFVVLPAAVFLIAILEFDAPAGLEHLDPFALRVLLIVNSILMFTLTCFLIYLFYGRLEQAEIRIRTFSGAVSEYLDPQLVDRLHDGVDVGPSVRPLTVFFADLAGSTRLSMAMDEESYGRTINAYVREMEAVIKRHGAYIEDISGDGILGYLGNFESRGQTADAVRVVELALAMQARLAALNPELRRDFGLPEDLRLRIGVGSGPAVVGKTDGVRAIYTANGEAVNLAAKIEDCVRDLPGGTGILISTETAALVGDRFDLEEHALMIEGERVTAYAVNG